MQTKVLLVNVETPNFDDVEFANRLLSSIPYLNTHLYIFGGDLNCVFDPVFDRLCLNLYSRIDFFFIDNSLNSCVVSTDYLTILVSNRFLFFVRLSVFLFRLQVSQCVDAPSC